MENCHSAESFHINTVNESVSILGKRVFTAEKVTRADLRIHLR